jgi:thymidine kinase
MEVGKLVVILGPMFAGKSTKLIEIVNRYNIMKRKTIVLKYHQDNRYGNGDKLITHDKREHPAFAVSEISAQLESLGDYDIIGIDEGQFYSDVYLHVKLDRTLLQQARPPGEDSYSFSIIKYF